MSKGIDFSAYDELSDEIYRLWGLGDFYMEQEKWSKAGELYLCAKGLCEKLKRLARQEA